MAEVTRHPLLTREEEHELAVKYRDNGDVDAAYRLVASNLRLVVKIAHEYRRSAFHLLDLIQEGNMGLMQAVKKYDPFKGVKLSSYAAWWIRAYIIRFIMDNWRMVKLGTTQAQRKLFFSLARTRRELEKYNAGDGAIPVEEIARRLRVKPTEVREMEQRMGGRDLSLDAPMGEDGSSTHVDFVASPAAGQDEEVADKEQAGMINARVRTALTRLDPRERFIIEQRVMNERPMTLKELGEHFGFSRERARQLEIRAKDKLKAELAALMAEMEPEIAA
jgi:RNA polymerase sigma-32 factor